MYKVFKQPIGISNNFYSHQDDSRQLSRHQENPMFRVPNYYYTAKKNTLSPKYYTNIPKAANKQGFITHNKDPHSDSIEEQNLGRLQINNWNHNTRTRQNIKQLRASVQSLEKMIQKSQQILRSSSKKSFASNIKQNYNRNPYHTKVRSDSIKLKLKTESSIASSIESRKTKKNIKKESDQRTPNETNNFKRGILYTKNNNKDYSNTFPQQNNINVKRKIIFNPQTQTKIYTSNSNIRNTNQAKPKHIMSFQRAKKQYEFELTQEQLEKCSKKGQDFQQQRYQPIKQRPRVKNFSSLTLDLSQNQIDYSKDKIRIQDGMFSPINNKVSSPTAYSSLSAWHCVSDHKIQSSSHKTAYLNNDHSFATITKDTTQNQWENAKMTEKSKKNIITSTKHQFQDNDNVDFKIKRKIALNAQNQQPIYFTGKNLSRYYHEYNKKKRQESPICGVSKGKYSIFPQKTNSSSRKIVNNYFQQKYQSNNQSSNQSRSPINRKREKQFQKDLSPCSRHSKNTDRYKRQHFIKKLQKYAFVQKYLTNKQIGCIYEGLKKTDIPQSKWILIVIDEVYKKMNIMNKSFQAL